MHISKEMVNEELRKSFLPARWIAFFLSKRWMARFMNTLGARIAGKNIDELHCEETYIPSNKEKHHIRVRIFRPKKVMGELPGFLYLHGGGYMIGKPEMYIDTIKKFIDAKPCVVVAPDYRKALDAPYPAAFDDCFDTLLWMKEHAEQIGIIPERFVVGGHSAGGGLTAAISLKARDTQEVKVAFQLPIYPMIDDRQITQSAVNSDAPAWNSKSNQLGWQEYLKGLKKQNLEIPAYAAPARATNYAGLPPTISIVGELEPFRDETIEYIEKLRDQQIPVAFQVYEGCFHGFDIIVPDSSVSKDAWRFVLDSFSKYMDTYFLNQLPVEPSGPISQAL